MTPLRLIASFLLAAGLCACAQPPEFVPPPAPVARTPALSADVATERFAAIQVERDSLKQRQATDEAECYRRFIVNSCLLGVRARYRPLASAQLVAENAVRAGERERREQERQVRVEEQRVQSERDHERAVQRAAAGASPAERQAELAQRNAERDAGQPAQAASARSARSSAEAAHAKAVADQAQRAAAAPGERQGYEARQKAAAERRAAQRRREAERATQTKPPVQPLPEKPGAASPSIPVR